eukprot:11290249-Heterocapsa_arctica.AAC.1
MLPARRPSKHDFDRQMVNPSGSSSSSRSSSNSGSSGSSGSGSRSSARPPPLRPGPRGARTSGAARASGPPRS